MSAIFSFEKLDEQIIQIQDRLVVIRKVVIDVVLSERDLETRVFVGLEELLELGRVGYGVAV